MLSQGKSFDVVAKEYSIDPGSAANGGDLGEFPRGMMVPEFEKAAFELAKPGDVSEPVKTQFGWHIIKLEERIPESTIPFEQIKERLTQELREQKTQEILQNLTKELILEKLEILNESLKRDFVVRKPRIAVLGLNPHCGDHGVIGNEEETVIIPAINDARGKDILAFGPYSADGFFGSGDFKKFDAVLAMYHDQGLAPFKALTFDDGVNFTAGLPIVRTSPAHGTAYEIAGKNQANYLPMCNAIRMAVDIFNNRRSLTDLEESRHNVDDYNINEINTVDE